MRKRNNHLQRKVLQVIDKIQIKYESLSIAKQATLVGSILGIISLFIPWVLHSGSDKHSWNAFHSISGNIGFILIIVLLLEIFLILSESYKEKLKLYTDMDLKNHFLIILTGIFTIILSIIAISFTVGLSFMSQDIQYGNGPIFAIIGGILITIGGIFIRIEDKKNNSEIILQKLSENRNRKKEKQNMELPF